MTSLAMRGLLQIMGLMSPQPPFERLYLDRNGQYRKHSDNTVISAAPVGGRLMATGDLAHIMHEVIPEELRNIPGANAYALTDTDFVLKGNEKIPTAHYYQSMKI